MFGFSNSAKKWSSFGERLGLHDHAWIGLSTVSGKWPREIKPEWFSAESWPDLVARVRDYQTMPYPIVGLKERPDAPRPTYHISDDAKISRESDPGVDMALFQVRPRGLEAMPDISVLQSGGLGPAAAFRMIQHFSELALSKFTFALPWVDEAHRAASTSGKTILVPEHVLVERYMGVENALFEVYENLPEGGRITKKAVIQTLLKILDPARD